MPNLHGMEWDDLRYLLAVARHGSLTAAARALGVTQPTMGRHLAQIEARLGAAVFDRTRTGLQPNTLGASLLEPAKLMEQAAAEAARRVAADDTSMAGLVRIATTEWVGQHLLAPVLARFCHRYPDITVELLPGEHLPSPAYNDTDIALRTTRIDQGRFVQRRVGRLARNLYASQAYLQERGEPDYAAGCPGHVVIAPPVRSDFGYAHWLTERLAPNARVALRSGSLDVHVAAAAAGTGLAVLPRMLANEMANLRRLAPPETPPPREIWLAFHEDYRHTPRVRAMADHIAGELKAV